MEPLVADVVVDASVIAALVLGETKADDAVTLLSGRRLLAPTLLQYEVANAARHYSTRHPGNALEVRGALSLCWRLPFRWVAPDMGDVLGVALRTGLTCYDAAYLVVAQRAGAPLVTFDERLAAACREAGVGLRDST